MKNIVNALFLFCCLFVSEASAQGSGQLQAGQIWGNPTGAAKPATGTTIAAMLNVQSGCSTQGNIYTRGASAWACLAPGATVRGPLLSNGAGADLSYSGIAYPASATSGGLACFTSTTLMTSSSLLTANAILLGGGAGVCPSPMGSLGTTTTVLHGNAGGAPTFGAVAYADIATADIATLAQYLAGTASKLVQSGVIYTAEVTTTYGTTTTFDFSLFINTVVTLTGNITTQTLSNVTAGKAGTITFIQDGTGSRTTVWNSVFKFAGGTTPTLSTTASAIDVLSYSCRSATFCVASLIKDVR